MDRVVCSLGHLALWPKTGKEMLAGEFRRWGDCCRDSLVHQRAAHTVMSGSRPRCVQELNPDVTVHYSGRGFIPRQKNALTLAPVLMVRRMDAQRE